MIIKTQIGTQCTESMCEALYRRTLEKSLRWGWGIWVLCSSYFSILSGNFGVWSSLIRIPPNVFTELPTPHLLYLTLFRVCNFTFLKKKSCDLEKKFSVNQYLHLGSLLSCPRPYELSCFITCSRMPSGNDVRPSHLLAAHFWKPRKCLPISVFHFLSHLIIHDSPKILSSNSVPSLYSLECNPSGPKGLNHVAQACVCRENLKKWD